MPKHTPHKKTEVTNDQLARMIAVGFAETATKQELFGVETRLGGVEHQLEGVKTRLTVVETKVDRALYSEITNFEARLRRVEHKVGINPGR